MIINASLSDKYTIVVDLINKNITSFIDDITQYEFKDSFAKFRFVNCVIVANAKKFVLKIKSLV